MEKLKTLEDNESSKLENNIINSYQLYSSQKGTMNNFSIVPEINVVGYYNENKDVYDITYQKDGKHNIGIVYDLEDIKPENVNHSDLREYESLSNLSIKQKNAYPNIEKYADIFDTSEYFLYYSEKNNIKYILDIEYILVGKLQTDESLEPIWVEIGKSDEITTLGIFSQFNINKKLSGGENNIRYRCEIRSDKKSGSISIQRESNKFEFIPNDLTLPLEYMSSIVLIIAIIINFGFVTVFLSLLLLISILFMIENYSKPDYEEINIHKRQDIEPYPYKSYYSNDTDNEDQKTKVFDSTNTAEIVDLKVDIDRGEIKCKNKDIKWSITRDETNKVLKKSAIDLFVDQGLSDINEEFTGYIKKHNKEDKSDTGYIISDCKTWRLTETHLE